MTMTQGKQSVAEFVRQRLLETPKTQREIALASGFDQPNVITMIKQGSTKLPLNRIGPLARALEVDPVVLLRLALSEYLPDTWAAIEPLLSAAMLTADERQLVEAYRRAKADTTAVPKIPAGDETVTISQSEADHGEA